MALYLQTRSTCDGPCLTWPCHFRLEEPFILLQLSVGVSSMSQGCSLVPLSPTNAANAVFFRKLISDQL